MVGVFPCDPCIPFVPWSNGRVHSKGSGHIHATEDETTECTEQMEFTEYFDTHD